MREGRFRRAYLGITGGSRPLPPRVADRLGRLTGVEVVDIVPGSPAETAGLRPEDLIVEVGGEAVADVGDLQRLMVADLIGREIRVRLFRDGDVVEVGAQPAELEA
jgi:S1-C subfamily serine protease